MSEKGKCDTRTVHRTNATRLFQCGTCRVVIESGRSVHFAYDVSFCSNLCRTVFVRESHNLASSSSPTSTTTPNSVDTLSTSGSKGVEERDE